MINRFFAIFLLVVLAVVKGNSQQGVERPAAGGRSSTPELPTGARLKTLAGSLRVGFLANANTEQTDLVIIDREANAIQNPFYPFSAWADTFLLDDKAVQRNREVLSHARKMGQHTVHHLLVGPDTYMPDWFKKRQFTSHELDSMLHWYIKSMISAYEKDGLVNMWNVVNEALSCKGDDWEAQCKWLAMGYEQDASGLAGADRVFDKVPVFIRKAFEYARLYTNSDLELRDYANDGLDRGVAWGGGCGATDDVKTRAFYQLIRHLLNQGVPVTAVGLQCHLYQDVVQDFGKLGHVIRKYKDLGLKVYLNEIDVNRRTSSSGNEGQRVFVEQLFRAALDGGADGFFFWGVRDLHSWKGAEQKALIFDDDGRAKPAYYGIQAILAERKGKRKSD